MIHSALEAPDTEKTSPNWWTLPALIGLAMVLVATVVANLPASPRFLMFPGRDSGVFLYLGDQILQGNVPYRDAWDHKAPGIYYINALGLSLGDGSMWGVWVLETIFLCAASFACYWLLHAAFGTGTALVATSAYIGGLVLVLQGGTIRDGSFLQGNFSGTNLTETYALVFQFAALALLYASERKGFYGWRGVLIGASASWCALLRPNLVAIPVAIALVIAVAYVSQRRWRDLFSAGILMAAGAALILAPVCAYFVANGSFDDLIDAVFRYNTFYMEKGSYSFWEGVALGFRLLNQSWLSSVALVGLGISVVTFGASERHLRILLAVVAMALPIEMYFSTMSGRNFAHYFLSWLPIVSVLAGVTIWTVLRGVKQLATSRVTGWIQVPVVASLVAALTITPLSTLGNLQLQRNDHVSHIRLAIADQIATMTTDQDLVLVWGAETSVNFMADRSSPTRYAYQYPLYLTGYQDPAMVEQFLGDLRTTPPALILDTSASNTAIPPIDWDERATWESNRADRDNPYDLLPQMDAVFAFIEGNYQPADRLIAPGGVEWIVYERNDRLQGGAACSSQVKNI